MRYFRQLCWNSFAVSMLVLAFACSAFAGDIPYPGTPALPPAVSPVTDPLLMLLQMVWSHL